MIFSWNVLIVYTIVKHGNILNLKVYKKILSRKTEDPQLSVGNARSHKVWVTLCIGKYCKMHRRCRICACLWAWHLHTNSIVVSAVMDRHQIRRFPSPCGHWSCPTITLSLKVTLMHFKMRFKNTGCCGYDVISPTLQPLPHRIVIVLNFYWGSILKHRCT